MSESSVPSSTSPQQIIVQTSSTSDENSSFFNGTGKQGTYLSFILLLLSIVASIILQRYAPDNIDLSSWDKGCSVDYLTDCKANSAVLRISFALSILFALQAIGSILYTKFYDWFWSPKYAVFFCICVGFYFADSSVFNLDGYAWAARVTGFLYLIILQIILIDGAYTWNEQWVAFSVEEGEEKGQKWLIGIVVISCIIFIVSIGCIVLMFIQFTNGGSHSNCVDSKIILSLTIVLPAIATITQLFFTEEGSILTSAIITGYATYVCYSAVSLNPDTNCNPSLDSGYQKISVVIGLVLLVVSITWATFNAVRKIPVEMHTGNAMDLLSVATGGVEASSPTGEGGASGSPYDVPGVKALFAQVSILFLLVSGYYAMILTNWCTEQSGGSYQNPRTGRAAMWIQAAGQWIAVLLYLWSLIAPRVFADREFGA